MPRPAVGLLLLFLPALACPAGAAAQSAPTELTCTFEQGTQREDGDRASRRVDSELRLTFTGIDVAAGVANIAADDSLTGVVVVGSGRVVSFLEIMPSGNIAVTTVSTVGSDAAFPAVHSRHVFDSLRPGYIATQLYGSCVGRL